MKTFYCIYVGDMKWLGNMKRWQAYYLAFHVWMTLRLASNKKQIKIEKELFIHKIQNSYGKRIYISGRAEQVR